jgi:hypothetical protein
MRRNGAGLPPGIIELRARETAAAARLQQAREDLTRACAKFLETGLEQDRHLRIAAEDARDAAKILYDEARAARDQAEAVAARSAS